MKRKQRPSAAKRGTRIPTPAPARAPTGPSVAIADQLAKALRHHQAGQLAEAESHYRKILAVDQNHIDSLHLLGVIAHQVGRNDFALDLIGKAIALNDRNPAFHNNIGLAFDAVARTEDAVAHYRRAITLNPNYVDAHNNLGPAGCCAFATNGIAAAPPIRPMDSRRLTPRPQGQLRHRNDLNAVTFSRH
jgi:Flp pilus assembly protein TadD